LNHPRADAGDAEATGMTDDGGMMMSHGGPHDGSTPTDATTGGDGGNPEASAGDSGGVCGDTQSDPVNCGRCGHDCLGGKCVAGLCQPFAWHMGSYLQSLSVDDHHAFFLESAAINKADLGNMPTVQKMGGDLLVAGAFTADASYLYYWAALNGVERLSKASPPGGPDYLVNYTWDVTTDFINSGIAISGGYIYYAALNNSDGGAPPTHVYKAPKAPLSATLGSDGTYIGNSGPNEMVVLADSTADTLHLLDPMAGTIRVMSISTGAVTTLAQHLDGPQSLIADDTYLYWVNQTGGKVMTMPKTGGTPTVLVSGEDTPSTVMLDGANLYWTTASQLRTCPVRTCAGNVTTVAENQGGAKGVTSNRTALYWIANESIMRLAK
jgi:hypothetical protein